MQHGLKMKLNPSSKQLRSSVCLLMEYNANGHSRMLSIGNASDAVPSRLLL